MIAVIVIIVIVCIIALFLQIKVRKNSDSLVASKPSTSTITHNVEPLNKTTQPRKKKEIRPRNGTKVRFDNRVVRRYIDIEAPTGDTARDGNYTDESESLNTTER